MQPLSTSFERLALWIELHPKRRDRKNDLLEVLGEAIRLSKNNDRVRAISDITRGVFDRTFEEEFAPQEKTKEKQKTNIVNYTKIGSFPKSLRHTLLWFSVKYPLNWRLYTLLCDREDYRLNTDLEIEALAPKAKTLGIECPSQPLRPYPEFPSDFDIECLREKFLYARGNEDVLECFYDVLPENIIYQAKTDINSSLIFQRNELTRKKEIKTSKKNQPSLIVPNAFNNYLHFAHSKRANFYGRNVEKETLMQFLTDNRPRLWYQIAGSGGQGKSRLAYEIMDYAKGLSWSAGFMYGNEIRSFGEYWKSWQPDKNTLIIIDYVFGDEEKISDLYKNLFQKSQFENEAYSYGDNPKVRVLFLERSPWNQGYNEESDIRLENRSFHSDISNLSQWFIRITDFHNNPRQDIQKYRFNEGVVELLGVAEEKIEDAIKCFAPEQNYTDLEVHRIKSIIKRIDSSISPFFLILTISAFSSGGTSDFWTRESILDNIMERDYFFRWSKEFSTNPPTLSDDSNEVGLSLLSTILGGVNCNDVLGHKLSINVDAKSRIGALVINSASVGQSVKGPSNFIPPMKPEILGGWFVMQAFERNANYKVILQEAITLDAKKVKVFATRIIQDFSFPYYKELIEIVIKNINKNILDKYFYEAVFSSASGDGYEDEILGIIGAAGYSGHIGALVFLSSHARKYGFAQGLREHEWLEIGVGFESSDCANRLAKIYEIGDGVQTDKLRAFELYRFSHELRSFEGTVSLARCYDSGIGVEQSEKKALDLLDDLIPKLSSNQISLLGADILYGSIVYKDIYRSKIKKIESRILTSLRNGIYYDRYSYIRARLSGYFILNGIGHECNPEIAELYFKDAISMGDGVSARLIANTKIDSSYTEAVEYLSIATDLGDIPSMSLLGELKYHGLGAERDKGHSYTLIESSAMYGDKFSKFLLGRMYLTGSGKEFSGTDAIKLFHDAADLGCGRAFGELGKLALFGLACAQDDDTAFQYFYEGSDLQDPFSIAHLGFCYHHGIGTMKNTGLARHLYEKSAGRGDFFGQCSLILILLKETNHATDIKRAYSLIKSLKKNLNAVSFCESLFRDARIKGNESYSEDFSMVDFEGKIISLFKDIKIANLSIQYKEHLRKIADIIESDDLIMYL
ncbi:MAG: hypothetical protein AAGI89_02000 [Pseudomonadota bacterium]